MTCDLSLDAPPEPCSHPIRARYVDSDGIQACRDCGAQEYDEEDVHTDTTAPIQAGEEG